MRGVGTINFGGPDALQIIDLAEVHAGPGEVRIRVYAAAVSPTDTVRRSGGGAIASESAPPPHIPGMDLAGVIDEVHPDTDTELAVGNRVMAMIVPDGVYGAYRESINVKANAVALAPAGTNHVEASTLPMNGLTARLSLDLLGLEPGQTLAVTGAAGCYGGYVVEMAKANGLFVIADAAPKDEDLVRSFGADIVVKRGDNVADAIREVSPDGVDGLADGAVLDELVVPAVRDGGGFASVRGWKGNGARDIAFHPTWVRRYDDRADLLDEIRGLVEDSKVTLRVADTFSVNQAAESHRRLEAGGARGRFVIEF